MSQPETASLTILKPSSVKNSIRLMSTTGIALFIWGSPGISKSAVGMQVATEQNRAFVDVRLSMYAPTDVAGMPYRVEENGETTGVAFTPPKILPRNINIQKVKPIEAVPTLITFHSMNPKGSNGIYYVKTPAITVEAVNAPGTDAADILTARIVKETQENFVVELVDSTGARRPGSVYYTVTGEAEALVAFEELNSAPLATQQAAYQFILDRRIGEYVVPDGVSLIAMGNKQTDKGLTYQQPLPLANRFVHIEMRVDFTDWSIWATQEMIHPSVVGFLSNNKGALSDFDPSKASRGFATPRSWVFVSEIIKTAEKNGASIDLSNAELSALICGAVGDGIGAKYAAHRKMEAYLPKIEDVLSGATKKLQAEAKNNVALAYSLVTSIIYELRLRNEALIADNIAASSKDKRRVEWYQAFNTALEFMMGNFQEEVNVMAMRQMLTTHSMPIAGREHLPALTAFSKEYADLIK